jgi:hypothetical protein
MAALHKKPDAWKIVKTSLIVLVSAESGCIIAAAVEVMPYQYSTFLSVPASLLAATLALASIAARKSLKRRFVEQPG